MRLLDSAMTRHRHRPDSLIEILHTAQALFGYLDPDCLRYIARRLQIAPSRVYGVASFYNFFTLTPRGAHTCVLCMGTACYVNGSTSILQAIERAHHVVAGGTTVDGRLSLVTAHCIGACGQAPALILDHDIVGGLTAESTLTRLDQQIRP